MENNNKIIIRWFCGAFIATLLILVGYLCYSANTFKESQAEIVNEHIKHIAKVDSIFYEMKTIVLSNDSGTIANASALFSQLQKDSALFRREIQLSQEEMSHLVSLHIDKIDNDYAQIGIWGGMLSIIFLIFGFFAIFKIEEIKTEARNVLNDVEKKGEEAMGNVKELQDQASELNNLLTSIRQQSDTFIKDETTKFNELMESIHSVQEQSNNRLERINKLLEELENKDKLYNLSINTIKDQMKQLEELADMLKEFIKKEGKEASNE